MATATMLDKHLKPKTDRVSCRELEGETILLDLQADVYYYLNPAGSRAWTLLGEGHTGKAIAATLFDEFDAPLEQIEEDITQLLTDLLAMGLVEESG